MMKRSVCLAVAFVSFRLLLLWFYTPNFMTLWTAAEAALMSPSVRPSVRPPASSVSGVLAFTWDFYNIVCDAEFFGRKSFFFWNEREKIVKPVSAFCRYCLNLHTQKLCYRLLYSTNVFRLVGFDGRLVGMALCLASVRSGRKTEIEKVNKNLFFWEHATTTITTTTTTFNLSRQKL